MFKWQMANRGWRIGIVAACLISSVVCCKAQEAAPTATETAGPNAPVPTANPSVSPALSPLPATTPPAPAKTVRITFLPPPLEGTISLGIYDQSNKLVRVLHQEAELDEFI